MNNMAAEDVSKEVSMLIDRLIIKMKVSGGVINEELLRRELWKFARNYGVIYSKFILENKDA